MTHSRFADVYSLFEETVEVLPDDLVKDFMKDVDEIKQKLDKWKTLFAYEKEKKTFLEQKCHAGYQSELWLAGYDRDLGYFLHR